MAKQKQIRGGNQATEDAFTGVLREISVDTTNHRVRIHDGTTVGGFAAARLNEVVKLLGDSSVAGNVSFSTAADVAISFHTNTGAGDRQVTVGNNLVRVSAVIDEQELYIHDDTISILTNAGDTSLTVKGGSDAGGGLLVLTDGVTLIAVDPIASLINIQTDDAGDSQLYINPDGLIRIQSGAGSNQFYISDLGDILIQGNGGDNVLSIGSAGAHIKIGGTEIFTINSDGSASFVSGKIDFNSDGSVIFSNGNATIDAGGASQFNDDLHVGTKITLLSSNGSVAFADQNCVVSSDGELQIAGGSIVLRADGAAVFGNGNVEIHADGSGSFANNKIQFISDGSATFANAAASITVSGVFTGNGSGLTNLPAANLTGTVPTAALSYRAGNQAIGSLATTTAVVFSSAMPNTSYAIALTATGFASSPAAMYSSKTTTGFTINTLAVSGGGSVDYTVTPYK